MIHLNRQLVARDLPDKTSWAFSTRERPPPGSTKTKCFNPLPAKAQPFETSTNLAVKRLIMAYLLIQLFQCLASLPLRSTIVPLDLEASFAHLLVSCANVPGHSTNASGHPTGQLFHRNTVSKKITPQLLLSQPSKYSTGVQPSQCLEKSRFRKPLLEFCIIFQVFRVAFAILLRTKVLFSQNTCLHNSLSRSFRVDDSCSAYQLSRSFRGKWLRMDLHLCFRAAFTR